MKYHFNTIKEVRESFWQGNIHLKAIADKTLISEEFISYVDMLHNEKLISTKLANSVTLGNP